MGNLVTNRKELGFNKLDVDRPVVYFKTRVSPYHTEYIFMRYILKGNLLYILLPPEHNLRSRHGRLLNSIPKEKLALSSKLLRSLKAQPYIQTIQCSGSITAGTQPAAPSHIMYHIYLSPVCNITLTSLVYELVFMSWDISVYCSRLRSVTISHWIYILWTRRVCGNKTIFSSQKIFGFS